MNLTSDIRHAIRGFARNPAFAAAALVSLAIGIGANSALFSVTSALLLRPLPYKNADRLVILWNRSPGLNIAEDWFSTAQYFDIKNGHSGLEQVAIAIGANYNLTGDGDPERIGVVQVSSNLLPMLGARPTLGRLFVAEEDAPGRPGSAVLGYGMWTRRFGNDPRVVGRRLILNGQTYTIAGVLSREFSLPREVLPTLGVAEDGEIFLPLPLAPSAATTRTREDYNIVGTLKPGVTVARAQAEMDALTARLRRDFPNEYPPNGGLTFSILPLLDQVVGNVRRAVLILLGSVGFVLLIACSNVANLMLSRALAREKEFAVRAALGASRSRIVRQLLTESVLLSLAGGALGAALAYAAVRGLHWLQPPGLPRLRDIAIDGRVVLFTFAISAAAGVVFGLAPALAAGRLNVYGTLKDAARGSGAALWGRGHRLRRALVVAELALAVVLLVGAGLLIRSFARLQNVAPGFDANGVLTVELTMNGRKYANGPAVIDTYRQLWERLERLPGVTASGGVSALPLSGYFSWGPITVEGRTPPPGEKFINADQRVVSGRYFEAMGIPLVRGRFFDDQDTADHPRVTIVDEFMASELWPNQDPIGKRLHSGDQNSTSPWRTVVGVVGRVKQYTLDADGRIALYLAHTQNPSRAMYVTVKTAGDPAALAPQVAKEIRALDPDLPLYHVRPMTARVGESLARQRFAMLVLSVFAAVALALASVGIYGVMAYLVGQGTREIGIRMALGASQRRVLAMIVRHGMAVALTGAAIGVAGALALSRVMRSLLFGVQGSDPLTFVAVSLLLAAIALVATYLPARRAATIDPMISLRSE
ncbi:MAG TPA: ABC transporter permease [Vicinamibacterales bacterium]|jgi:predicted permease|nr:ABC transporter permease [Vicinamibacterales bacterium]